MADDFRGPAARGFIWDHIMDAHSDFGATAQLRTAKKHTTFIGLTERQIRARVKAAWKKRSRIETQTIVGFADRICYRGNDANSGQVIEFWYNVETHIVESAYPAGVQP